MFEFDVNSAQWFFPPLQFSIGNGIVAITTDPKTDFWQRTYYGFRNDNAHVLYTTTSEPYFSFTVKTAFQYSALFDQCGIALYQDSENWAKAGIEFHDNNTMWLGSVVTNGGYSDWATADIGTEITAMWYRLSRRNSDFLFENSVDGVHYSQMRIFHLMKGDGAINFGLLACSPGSNSFDAFFSDIKISECVWKQHSL
jgi:regulation of enolase protein 1 (concanavalin A-like superfamily)